MVDANLLTSLSHMLLELLFVLKHLSVQVGHQQEGKASGHSYVVHPLHVPEQEHFLYLHVKRHAPVNQPCEFGLSAARLIQLK